MAATARFPGSLNTFVPQATGQAIAYVQDPSEFAINKYAQIFKSPKPLGIFYFLDPDFPVRVVSDEEFAWEDGDEAPAANYNLGNFKAVEFRVFRRAYPYTIGEQAIETAEGWDPRAFHNASILSQAMVNRTNRAVEILEDESNWADNHADANDLNEGAGFWDQASNDPTDPNFLTIRKSILEAARRINVATNTMVRLKQLRLVIQPQTAIDIANSDEMNGYLRGSPSALAQARGEIDGENTEWGLPNRYAGAEIVVEDCVRASVRAQADGTAATTTGASPEKTYVKSRNSAFLCARPGSLQGNYGSPSYSTFQIYYYKYNMAVEARQDSWHKRYQARVIDQHKGVLAAPQAGFLIKNIRSTG